jgi:hypothetical protein
MQTAAHDDARGMMFLGGNARKLKILQNVAELLSVRERLMIKHAPLTESELKNALKIRMIKTSRRQGSVTNASRPHSREV